MLQDLRPPQFTAYGANTYSISLQYARVKDYTLAEFWLVHQ